MSMTTRPPLALLPGDMALYAASDVLRRTGITPRQLQAWSLSGKLRCRRAEYGSGYPWSYSEREIQVISEAARLLGLGFSIDAALALARRVHEGHDRELCTMLDALRTKLAQVPS